MPSTWLRNLYFLHRTTAFPALGLEMTSVRTFMTVMTLGAATASYVYLQQSPAAGESIPPVPSLFDWNGDARSKSGDSHVPAKDLAGRIHEHTRSVLDDFAIQHGGEANVPTEDAFERLRQIAQSISAAPANSSEDMTRPGGSAAPSAIPNFDELQRTAFDPAADAAPAQKDAVKQVDDLVVTKSDIATSSSADDVAAIPPADSQSAPVNPNKTVAPQESEPIASTNRPTRVQPLEQVRGKSPVSIVSQLGSNQGNAKSPVVRNGNNEASGWKVVGKTTEGRPMHTMHLGDSGTRTLVIAGINGTDRTAVRWLELLAAEFQRQPDLVKNNEIVLFRAGNPDGLVRGLNNNVRGVPLNRNFPSRRYRPTTDIPAFAVPAGEAETRVMLDTLYTFRPRRVIHLMASTGESQVVYNRPAKGIALEMERSTRIVPMPMDVEQLPGSMEDFADGTLEAAVVAMRLGIGNDWQQAWNKLQPSVISAVLGQTFEPGGREAVNEPDPDRSPIPAANIEPVSRKPRRSGYEELPAPPI